MSVVEEINAIAVNKVTFQTITEIGDFISIFEDTSKLMIFVSNRSFKTSFILLGEMH